MDADLLHVTWTMDCETIDEESPTGGPATWELSETAMRGYVERLAELGHRVTLFLIPRVAESQPELLIELRDAGADLGMHMHPQTTDIGIDAYLGQLSRDEQLALLGQGRDRIARALGEAPVSFRAGNFSGSDDTHPVLAELGFIADSTPLPGRVMPDLAAVWPGAEPFVHRASATSRLGAAEAKLPPSLPERAEPSGQNGRRDARSEARWRGEAGDLPLLVCPTAVDLGCAAGEGDAPLEAPHLRLERAGILGSGPPLLQAHLRRQAELGLPLKSLVVMTHNTSDFADPSVPARQALDGIAESIAETAEDLGLQVRAATLAELAREVL